MKAIGNLSHVCTPETITVVTGSEDAYKPGLDQVPISRVGETGQPHLYDMIQELGEGGFQRKICYLKKGQEKPGG